jgi:hypothetical protein
MQERTQMMGAMSRRAFLRNGSMAVMGAGLLATPGLSSVLGSAGADAPALDNSAASASADASVPANAALDNPLVAHVKDVRTGEIGVYFGTKEVTMHDPRLAARLYRIAG